MRPAHDFDIKTKDIARKENYKPTPLINTHAKILNIIAANQIQQQIKRIIYHDQVQFTQKCKLGLAFKHQCVFLMNLFCVTSIDAGKVFDKIQHLFLIKILNKQGVE